MPLKYYFVFVLTVLLFAPLHVFAARAVPGVVPSVVPLFPTPVGVEPNLRGNVQYQGESVFSTPEQAAEQVQVPSAEGAGEGVDAGPTGASGQTSPTGGTSWKWVVAFGGVLVLGVVGWSLYRKRKTSV